MFWEWRPDRCTGECAGDLADFHGARSHIFAWHYGPFPINPASQSQSVPISSPHLPQCLQVQEYGQKHPVCSCTSALAEHGLGLWAVGKLLCSAWGWRKLLWPVATSGTARREIFSRPIKKSVCASLVELICG